jgi:predicted phage tail protein
MWRFFIHYRWGDSVGLYLIHMGVALVIGSIWVPATPDADKIAQMGYSLVLTGVGMLKLKASTSDEINGALKKAKPAEPPKDPEK